MLSRSISFIAVLVAHIWMAVGPASAEHGLQKASATKARGETAAKLQAFCEPLVESKTFSKSTRSVAANLVTNLLGAERKAIQAIEEVLKVLNESD